MTENVRPFLTAEWRCLVMLNYEVDASLLARYVPGGAEPDYWQQKTYVSLVGFLFQNTCVRDCPIPFHRHFEEVNLRLYVRRGDHRGVVFIREIVPRRAVAWIANALYGENYVYRPMRHRIDANSFEYSWRDGGQWNRIIAEKLGPSQPLISGLHEEFITEHFWGYTRRSPDLTSEYRVDHSSWRVQTSGAARFEGAVAEVYPRDFAFIGERPPDTAFVADGSPIAVFPAQRLPFSF